jgi:menaquinone-dependent protoporphyrinogen oxidase
MARLLLLYGTAEGHTQDVVGVLYDAMLEAQPSLSIHRHAIENAPDGVDGHDAVLLGSSIHVGRHHHEVVAWAKHHHEELARIPSAFFQVSLSSADPAHQDQAVAYVDELIEATGWHPDLVGLFGGALLYTRYGYAKRHLVKAIAKRGGLGTDTHRDYDYTDYDAVRHFAGDVPRLFTEPS